MSPPRNLQEKLGRSINTLYREMAAYAVRDRAFQALVMLLCSRLSRLKQRFTLLAQQFQAGTLRPPRRRGPRSRRPVAAATVAAPPDPAARPKLPRRFGWLAYWVPGTIVFGLQLEVLVADPEMQALLRAAPQLGRLLRPLMRMLAVRPLPEVLRLPPRSPRPKPARPPRAKPARPARPKQLRPPNSTQPRPAQSSRLPEPHSWPAAAPPGHAPWPPPNPPARPAAGPPLSLSPAPPPNPQSGRRKPWSYDPSVCWNWRRPI